MPKYYLSKKAEKDLDKIADYSISTWGIKQAKKYRDQLNICLERITNTSGLGRKIEMSNKSYLRYNCKKHIIFFKERKDNIFIVRILNEKMDHKRHL